MLCFSPGKQLPLSTGWLRFSKEEKSIIERKPRGSPASPVNTPGGPALCGRAGSPRPGRVPQQARVCSRRAGPCLGQPESPGKRRRWQRHSHEHPLDAGCSLGAGTRTSSVAPQALCTAPEAKQVHISTTSRCWGQWCAERGSTGRLPEELAPDRARAGWADRREGRMAGFTPGGLGQLWGSVEAEGVKGLPGHCRGRARMRLTAL